MHRILAASLLALGAVVPAHAGVVASLTQPPGGLGCAEAADQAQVVFDFNERRSELGEISVFIDGKGVPERAIAEEWPRLTLLEGLHAGRNKVEIYATGKDGKTEAHTLTVLAGESPRSKDKQDVAIVDCVGGGNRVAERKDDRGREVIAEADDDTEEVIEDVRTRVADDDDDVEEVIYEDAPRYVYRTYPAYPYVSYYPVYYYPWPYYYGSYGYYGYRSYPGYYYGAHGAPYYGHHSHGGLRSPGSYWDRGNRAPRPSRPPTHQGHRGRH